MNINNLTAAQNVKLGTLHVQQVLKNQEKTAQPDEAGREELAQMREQFERMQKDSALSLIDGKLRCGKELTKQELEFLKRENPELYKEARELEIERRLYRKMLERSRTKRDVHNLHLHTVGRLLTEAETIKKSGLDSEKKREQLDKITRRIAGTQDEYSKFVASDKYSRLPYDERDKKGVLPSNKKRPVYYNDISFILDAQSAGYEWVLSAINEEWMKEKGRAFPDGSGLNLLI